MPPKKVVKEEKLLLGRPSNNLKIGIVGLPNVGKSTFFNAITNSAAAAENYPFCTIDPEESRVAVPDPRFDDLCVKYKPASKVPAYLTVIDIAGLVKGASSGAGLGNAFLSHIRSVDAIFHVVRSFSDPDVTHVEGEIDPVRDLEIIHEELRLKDIELVKKFIESTEKVVMRMGSAGSVSDKEKKEELIVIKKVLEHMESGKDVRKGEWSNKEIEVINRHHLITAKPVIYLANVSEKDYIRKKNKYLPKIKAWIDENYKGDLLIPFSGAFEHSLTVMDPQAKEEYLKTSNAISILPKIIVSGYSGLNLIYFFTSGSDEVRAWTIRNGTKAPQAAGTIHTDFERGFITAEVFNYKDLHELGSESAVKAAGKYNQKGKDYVVQDGDIIFFKFNNKTPAGICSIDTQSSGCLVESEGTDKMYTIEQYVQVDRQPVRSSRSGDVCITSKLQAERVCEFEMLSRSDARFNNEADVESESDTFNRSHPISTKRKVGYYEEQVLVIDSMENKRISFKEMGINGSAVNLMLDSLYQPSKSKKHSYTHRKPLEWRKEKSIVTSTITAVVIISFLEFGRIQNKWKYSTINEYRSSILNLVTDAKYITEDVIFKQYSEETKRLNVKSFDFPAYDITLITGCLKDWGENSSLSPEKFTQKLFSPKEKHGGSTIEKICDIHMHSIEYLCLVNTYLEYKKRISATQRIVKHPINGNIKNGYLIRSLLNHNNPKALALGSTLAKTAGATDEDVAAQGFWFPERNSKCVFNFQ
ncbi:hypothetical protein BB560_002574, partial [Smittium megazygosporum]